MNYSLRQQYLEAIGVQNWQLKSAPDYSEQNVLADAADAHSYDVSVPAQTIEVIKKVQPEEQRLEQNGYGNSVSDKLNISNEPAVEPSELNVSLEQNNTLFETSDNTDSHESPTILQPDINKSLEVECLEAGDVPPISLVANTVELVSELDQSITQCKQCTNRQTRLNALPGQGNSNASIFIISEAPTAEEDRSGQYLNQQSALLLESMFQSIDFSDDYFYTGIIKCYSFSDYLFTESEVAQCAPFLYTQIEQTQPSVLVVFGAIQAQAILQSQKTFNELRGKIHLVTINDKEYPVIVTYHPAYLLRNPLYKREALSDLIMIKKLCNE